MSEGIYLSDNQTQFRPQMKARLPVAIFWTVEMSANRSGLAGGKM